MISFKSKVDEFWKNFSKEDGLFRKMIDENNYTEVRENINNILSKVIDISFEIGKNKDGKYELIITGEGNRTKSLIANYWIKNAPQKLYDQWNFYNVRPRATGNFAIRMYETDFKWEDFIIYPKVNNQNEKIDIEIFSKKFAGLSKEERYNITFIYFDTFIGENYTESYIGKIKILNSKKLLIKNITISDLFQYIEGVIANNNWNKYDNPCEIYTGYQLQPKEESIDLRDDILFGYSSNVDVVNFYYTNNEWFKDMGKDGIIFGFLYYNNADIDINELVTFRSIIEDKLNETVKNEKVAEIIGGATGINNSYIDFIIFDENNFIDAIKHTNIELKELYYRQFYNSSKNIKII